MSDHDILSSDVLKLKRQLEQYVDEYEPQDGEKALELVTHLAIAINKFIDEDCYR